MYYLDMKLPIMKHEILVTHILEIVIEVHRCVKPLFLSLILSSTSEGTCLRWKGRQLMLRHCSVQKLALLRKGYKKGEFNSSILGSLFKKVHK